MEEPGGPTVHGVERILNTTEKRLLFLFALLTSSMHGFFLLSSNRAHRGSRRAAGCVAVAPPWAACCVPSPFLGLPGVPMPGCPSKLAKGDPRPHMQGTCSIVGTAQLLNGDTSGLRMQEAGVMCCL